MAAQQESRFESKHGIISNLDVCGAHEFWGKLEETLEESLSSSKRQH